MTLKEAHIYARDGKAVYWKGNKYRKIIGIGYHYGIDGVFPYVHLEDMSGMSSVYAKPEEVTATGK